MSDLEIDIETKDNHIEHYRKEALNWANIANEYHKENQQLRQKFEQLECKICSKRVTMLDIITDESEE